MAGSFGSTPPCDTLKEEHRVIERVLQVLAVLARRSDRGEGFDEGGFSRCVEFFRLFADACHHGKEEDLLFPALIERGMPGEGGPIAVMLYEHNVGRKLVTQIAEAIKARAEGDPDAEKRATTAAMDFYRMLTQHIDKEDNVLFRMGEQILPPEAQANLCTKFDEVGCRAFQGKRQEELRRLADDLCREYAPGT
ncbi:MAG: hemerythrin domain-containing protein [Planctomycetes bacterium]|nr:hemerythrin domain-containing protein [Planctomycetota bacterium]